MNANYDWTKFKKQTFIRATPAEVFDAWTKPGEITKWFIAQAEYRTPDGRLRASDEPIQPGDRYYWRWHQEIDIHGEILSVSPGHEIRFTFGDKEKGSDEKILVTVSVAGGEQHDTTLTLTQENMADTPDAHAGWHLSCNLGWSFFMTNLKALLEHGIDLREVDPARAAASRAINLAWNPALSN